MMKSSTCWSRSPVSEEQVVQAICLFLEIEGYRVRREVPNMGQSIDVTATKNRWVTAIEAKVSNWKRALEQCMAHELIADFICIAIATKTVSPFFQQEASLKGYGILHVDYLQGNCSWVERPKKNNRVWPAQRKRFAEKLRGISYE